MIEILMIATIVAISAALFLVLVTMDEPIVSVFVIIFIMVFTIVFIIEGSKETQNVSSISDLKDRKDD
jgi:hypothetical protein